MITQYLNSDKTLNLDSYDLKEKKYDDVIGTLDYKESKNLSKNFFKFISNIDLTKEESNQYLLSFDFRHNLLI